MCEVSHRVFFNSVHLKCLVSGQFKRVSELFYGLSCLSQVLFLVKSLQSRLYFTLTEH